MKTVVYISGQPREVAHCWKSWWYNCICNFPNPEVFIYSSEKYPVDKEFFDTVKPRKYLIEPQRDLPEHRAALNKINYVSDNHKNSLAQQQYGKKMVWELADRWQKETGVKYDYAIRLRPDLIIMQKISPEIIDFSRINTLNKKSDIVTCEFCISNFDIIKDYMHIYDWTVRFAPKICVRNHPRLPEGSCWHSDFMMGVYMEDVCKHKMAEGPHITTSSNYYRILRIFHQYGNIQFDTKI